MAKCIGQSVRMGPPSRRVYITGEHICTHLYSRLTCAITVCTPLLRGMGRLWSIHGPPIEPCHGMVETPHLVDFIFLFLSQYVVMVPTVVPNKHVMQVCYAEADLSRQQLHIPWSCASVPTKSIQDHAGWVQGWTPLHYLAHKGHLKMACLLLEHGACPDDLRPCDINDPKHVCSPSTCQQYLLSAGYCFT